MTLKPPSTITKLPPPSIASVLALHQQVNYNLPKNGCVDFLQFGCANICSTIGNRFRLNYCPNPNAACTTRVAASASFGSMPTEILISEVLTS